jgi:hypothetical protein
MWLGIVGGVLFFFRRELLAVWREPVLRFPVLIIESDDWGAGPVEAQANALSRLAEILKEQQDTTGRHPVMTLALILAVPDGQSILCDGKYHRLLLDDPAFNPVIQAIESGRAVGVFSLQLHGLEHYWPPALMVSDDPAVRAWIAGETPAVTEELPSHMQSRWINPTTLPSRPLDREAVREAAGEEIRLFERFFGEKPRVVVPPTFVWTVDTERAWADGGVEFVITPGLRSACRNVSGVPDCDTGPFRNGQHGEPGVRYLVRNDYFEPERGHRAEDVMQALAVKTRQGRPCLLETHRSNFIFDQVVAKNAFREIEKIYALASNHFPDLRYLTTLELGRAMVSLDKSWIEHRFRFRLLAWFERVRVINGFRRLYVVTGLGLVSKFARFTIMASTKGAGLQY